MTQDIEKLCAARSYIKGMLHATLMMIRNDLHMGDTKSALIKVNELIKKMENKDVD